MRSKSGSPELGTPGASLPSKDEQRAERVVSWRIPNNLAFATRHAVLADALTALEPAIITRLRAESDG